MSDQLIRVSAKFLLKDGSYFILTGDEVSMFERLYPKVDVPATLLEIEGWCWGHEAQRKTRRGAKRFVVDWLKREQEKA